MDAVLLRNNINHVVLNYLLRLRYLARRHRRLIACIVGFEAVCIRTGIIYYGRSRDRLRGDL